MHDTRGNFSAAQSPPRPRRSTNTRASCRVFSWMGRASQGDLYDHCELFVHLCAHVFSRRLHRNVLNALNERQRFSIRPSLLFCDETL